VSENARVIADRYELGNLIGRGGMADVYEGVDTRLGRVVAIKLMKSDLANDPTFETRFRQEAQASARMAHPNIVRIYDAGEEYGVDANGNPSRTPFIVMEYVKGKLLRDMMAEKRLTISQSIEYAEGVLTALEISHRAGIIHRDIKAANVMITDSGQVKVMDFGIARVVSESSATQAHTRGIVGTAQYFSPEQARGETVDARTDLYSTGVLLYEMLAGRPPFTGETAVSVAYQHVSEAVTPPSAHNPAIPAELDQVVMHSLAKDRADRFQTAEDFRDHLRASATSLKSEPLATQAAETIGDDFDALLAGARTEKPAEPKQTAEIPPIPTSGSKSFLDESAEKAPVAAAPAPATTRIKTAEPTEAITSNPFETIGVEFPNFTSEQPILTREIEKRRGLLWGVGAGLVVVLVGLMFWGLFQKGFNLNVDPNAGIAVADVVGQPFDAANATLAGEKLLVNKLYQNSDTVPAESVIKTDPIAGTKVPENTTITVYVSSGKDQIPVPSLEGMTEKDAQAALTSAGLTLGTITTANSATIKAGSVISTDPTTGNQVAKGSAINLVVSNGKVLVPDVTNLDITDAQTQLMSPSLGLTVTITTASACTGTQGTVVLSQSVAAGSTVAPGTNVTLIVACQP
jgi:serine/threonine protein kinase/beta-lactam-binding protein with PASTA domain